MITIDEIKRLNAERTQGEWFVKDWVIRNGDSRHTKDYTAIIFEEKDGVRVQRGFTSLTDHYNSFYNRVDEALFVAAPEIAAKCLELDRVNRELVDSMATLKNTLEDLIKYHCIAPNTGKEMVILINKTLAIAGAL